MEARWALQRVKIEDPWMEVTLPLAAREATRRGPKNLATGPKTGRPGAGEGRRGCPELGVWETLQRLEKGSPDWGWAQWSPQDGKQETLKPAPARRTLSEVGRGFPVKAECARVKGPRVGVLQGTGHEVGRAGVSWVWGWGK